MQRLGHVGVGHAPRLRFPEGDWFFLVALVYIRTYIMTDFEWDPKKANTNVRKHGVDFADAVGVFLDQLAITISDTNEEEERFVTIGMDFLGRTVVVVFAWRGDRLRIISTRRANGMERKEYQDSL